MKTKGNKLVWTFKTVFVILLLFNNSYSHSQSTDRHKSIHIGINSGILSGGIGPSFSFNYAAPINDILQPEAMLFYDSHNGSTFLTGYAQENFGYGLAAGLRVSILRKKKFSPSLVFMPGIIYSSEVTSYPKESVGYSGFISFGGSCTISQKHMISFAVQGGQNIQSFVYKYGFWF